MKNQGEYVKVWLSYEEYFSNLSREEIGRLVLGMIAYARRGEEPELEGNERFLWPVVRRDIDLAMEAKEALAAKRAACGRLGGRPRKDAGEALPAREEEAGEEFSPWEEDAPPPEAEKQKKQKLPAESKKSHGQGHGQGQGQGHGQCQGQGEGSAPGGAFETGGASGAAPDRPTEEEVRSYCAQKGYRFDPGRFYAHYAARGFPGGWRALAERWERTEYPRARGLPPPPAQAESVDLDKLRAVLARI